MASLTIPQPTAPFVDPKTGIVNMQWYLFLNSLLNIITPAGILPIADGGTNSGTALSGDSIMVSNGSQIIQGPAGTTTTVLHGNASGLPTYGAVNLSLDASGTLLAGQFPALTGDITTTAGALATLLKNTGTAGTYTKTTFDNQGRETSGTAAILASADFANQGTTITVLHGNAAGNPTFAAVSLTADVSGVLPYANGGTNTSTGGGGSWTPTDTSGAGLTFTLGTCSYIKLGMMVFAEFDITWPATLNASGVQIGGLPATSAADGNTWPVLISITTSGNTIIGRVLNSSTNFVFDTTGGVPFTNTQFTGQTLKGCVIYRAAT